MLKKNSLQYSIRCHFFPYMIAEYGDLKKGTLQYSIECDFFL